MSMTPAQFEIVRRFGFKELGITLEDGKEYLVESRLRPVLKQLSLDMDALTRQLSSVYGPELRDAMVDALTINETSFFRDTHPFTALRESIIPELMKDRAGTRRLRILSAASSTGQEAYSIAMLVREHFPQLIHSWDFKILGGDISDEALAKARRGQYSQMEVNRGLPVQLLVKYFTQDGPMWRISEDLKSMVEFRKMNITTPWLGWPSVDVVMCRNVLIYFDLPTRENVLREANKVLADDGFLFLGASETLLSLDTQFDMWKTGNTRCYRHKAGVGARRA